MTTPGYPPMKSTERVSGRTYTFNTFYLDGVATTEVFRDNDPVPAYSWGVPRTPPPSAHELQEYGDYVRQKFIEAFTAEVSA